MTTSPQTQNQQNQPAVNMKCIVFTMILCLGYWYLPYRNKWVLLALLYFPYLVMAWYDYLYMCKRNLGPTYLAFFYSCAKPQDSEQIKQYHAWDEQTRNKVWRIDMLVLVFVLGVLYKYYL